MLVVELVLVNIICYMGLFKFHEFSINNGETNILSSLNKMFLFNTYLIILVSFFKGLPIIVLCSILLAMFLLYVMFGKFINLLNNKENLSLKDLSLDMNIIILFLMSFIALMYNLSVNIL